MSSSGPSTEARIGPNSVLQTYRALQLLEPKSLEAVKARAQLPELPPGMIDEQLFVRLIRAVREELPSPRAEAVLRQSGAFTAQYVRENRIPPVARAVLAALPKKVSTPLLLKAISKHAWTFAGAGSFSVVDGVLTLVGAPTARAESLPPEKSPACAYYEAAFEGLLRLAARGLHVTERSCQGGGSPACQFHLHY